MINEEIKSISNEVRLVSNDGDGIKNISTDVALKLAEDAELDLVCINIKSNPPIVKICDYNKYIYTKNKKKKENKKQAKLNALGNKEVRLNPYIEDHDIKVKANTVDRLLNEHNRVTITIIYKGRNIKNIDNSSIIINKLLSYLNSKYESNAGIKTSGNRAYLVIYPVK